MFHPSSLLLWGAAVLALGFLAPDSWAPWGEVMKWIGIFLLLGSIYYDVRAWTKRKR